MIRSATPRPARRSVFALLLALSMLAAFPAPGHAAPSTASYLAARDQAIAALRLPPGKPITDAEATAQAAREKLALATLQPMLRALIGPLHLPGFAPAATITTSLIEGYVGSGQLDGLAVHALDDRTTGLLTTEPLLRAWLRQNAPPQRTPQDQPGEFAAAFGNAAFYSQALGMDAMANAYAEMPVGRPPGQAVIRVLLVRFGQDYVAPNPPDMLVAAAARNGKVVLLRRRVTTRIAPVPACTAEYRRDVATADAVYRQYQATHARDMALFHHYTDLENATDRNFRHCFAAAIPASAAYPALREQARALARLAAYR